MLKSSKFVVNLVLVVIANVCWFFSLNLFVSCESSHIIDLIENSVSSSSSSSSSSSINSEFSSNFVSIESDFYAKNSNKKHFLNDILVFISQDLVRKEPTNNQKQSFHLSMSKYLMESFLCPFKNNYKDLRNDCSSSSNTPNTRYKKPIRIVARALESYLSLADVKLLYEQIQEIYFKSKTAAPNDAAFKSLHGILILGDGKFLKSLNLLLRNLNVSIVAFDTVNHNFLKEAENSPPIDSIKHTIGVAEHLRKYTQLENVNFYFSCKNEINLLKNYKNKNGDSRSIKTITSVKNVLKHFSAAIAVSQESTAPRPPSFYSKSLNRNQYKKKKVKYKRQNDYASINSYHNSNFLNQNQNNHFWETTINPTFKSKIKKNSLKYTDVSLFFQDTSSTDLVVIKSNLDTFINIINCYSILKEKYFSNSSNIKSTFHPYRYFIWIPDLSKNLLQKQQYTLNDLLNMNNKTESFKIYIQNWHFDLDIALNLMINSAMIGNYDFDQIFRSFTRISLNLLRDSSIQNRLDFRVKDSSLIFLNNFPLNHLATTKEKLTYRIVSNNIEPFVIVSRLDEDLDPIADSDECKDGIPCLDLGQDINLHELAKNLDTNSEINKHLNEMLLKEKTISSIRNFKKHFNKSKLSTIGKAKCCTGYVINLLQKLASDLDFELEFYFLSARKYASFLSQNNSMMNSSSDKWNDAINHVRTGMAHIAAGPYTVTQERMSYADFTVPFLYTPYGILIKQEKKGVDDLFMFMRPFTYLHWGMLVLFGFWSAFSLAILEFNSPFGLNPKGRQRARNYTLGSAVSMVISLMVIF
jgi:hypothetical protein